MPRFARQVPVALTSGNVRLDAAVPRLRVTIELDGAAFHGDPAAREGDTRRDVSLAALRWVVLRSGSLQGPVASLRGAGAGGPSTALLGIRRRLAGDVRMWRTGVVRTLHAGTSPAGSHGMSRTGFTTSPVWVSAAARSMSASG